MAPPVQPGAHAASNPRRPPAHRSVSLLHSPPKKETTAARRSDSSSDSELLSRSRDSSQNSPSSLQPLGRNSSGESSNAEKWFEQSNNQVRDTSASFVDNEPPFFMRNSSSSDTPPEGQPGQRLYLGANDGSNSLPLRTGLMHLGTDGSSTEDFRSVIDDLTIANKKLKRRLKKYEKLHDSHLKDEKLFEVRVHGLPPEKKRELEEMLRNFASSLGGRSGGQGLPAGGYENLLPLLKQQQAGSSQVSLHNDSAYASMSASGQGGSSGVSATDSKSKAFNPSNASMRQNIQSYLHHIPEGLLPRTNPANMSERTKKKLVARRLEQIFSGKGAALGGHQQPVQQQEISQMAARADRSALEATGQRARLEGAREAHIMQDVGDKQDFPDDSIAERRLPVKTDGRDFANDSPNQTASEQRPTRPLDLDPHRAQVPAENLRYIRHLGFSPPDPESAPQDGHGWIYLNLLINMAQLHTINVTPDFVRKALTEYSNKFEVSPDGRKIRWKGRREYVATGGSSGGNSGGRNSSDSTDAQSPRKRPKLTHRTSSRSTMLGAAQAGDMSQRSQTENNKLVYTPMFFHKDSTDEADESSSGEEEEDTASPFPAQLAANSSGMTSSGMRTITNKKQPKHKDDGPIIFYNNTRFCTDLSGERRPEGNPNAPPYTKASSQPLGKESNVKRSPSERRGPLASATELPEAMDLGDNPIPESMELSFPPSSPLKTASRSSRSPVEMEVTGIGGVWPADNFAITVQSRHACVDQDDVPEVSNNVAPKHLPSKFANILHGPEAKPKHRAAVREEVVSSSRKDLPPSRLPDALCYMAFGDETPDSDDSGDDEESISPPSPGALPPSAAPQAMNLPYTDSDEDGDYSDGESGSSVDFLAAAREVDPEAIRAKEREYDANMAERLAEEIPAGSSAATAGGGSGFASPASGVAGEEYRRAKREARAAQRKQSKSSEPHPPPLQRPRTLKRAHTSDSMVVEGLENSSGGESEDEEMSDVKS
jgi:hypothetical protein